MTDTAAYKIVKLQELQQLRDEAERIETAPQIHHGVVVARYTADPAPDMPDSVVVVPGEPPVQRKVPPVPERLRNLSVGEIKIMAEDGELTSNEIKWLNNRRTPDYSTPSPWFWMTL